MSREIRPAARGLNFSQALTLLFIAAWLWGKIDWSLWWVLSPMLIHITITLIVAGIVSLDEIYDES